MATILNAEQLAALWIHAGGSLASAPIAVAKGLAESSGRTAVISANPDGGTNVGVWQLDTLGVGSGHSVAQLQDPLTNARLTVQASNDGRDWSAWPDNYQQYMPQATSAVQQLRTKAAHHPGGLPGYVGGILSVLGGSGGAGAAAAGALPTLTQLALPPSVVNFFDQAESIVTGALWLANPAHWARIVAGIAGVILLGFGLGVFMRAAT